ncbi:MAG: NUDIX hydrolase [Candidatus Thorarchaeota archaeon]|jgi:ADP-ribose pyrophosphatase YjhB (NUDIX family)
MTERRYPKTPLVGVGAIVVGSKGVLLVKRDKDPGKGLWSIPGGVIEIGETNRDATRREILEETGIEIELLDLLGVIDVILPDLTGTIEYHGVLIHYLARALTEENYEETPEGEVNWFEPRILSSLKLHPIMKRILSEQQGRIESLFHTLST